MRKIGIIGIICLCCVGAFLAMPASAFFGGDSGHAPRMHYAQGGALSAACEENRFGGFGAGNHGAHPAAPVLAALDESGYDTSELQALLDTAQEARENGDCETAFETMQEFRTELKTAVDESGIAVGFERCGFKHGHCFRSA
ncbi:hypothetical protein E2N92_02015 [Methanofollis formosanus]|uniref:Uncharacterized protein n=1 Tax=Methanofollis formosanus TaxID=299308 RepID=A0A8G0ZZA6_9EURY|nr:hypothetical protein [Methanofollis formosanus]QYZ78291.1 hypothetical protein E2N92_02015 [Methanofollis formosanus]